MGRHGSGNISNKVTRENVVLGFRVKSGWATVALRTGAIDSLKLCDNRVIDLCDQ
jgi:hypothetical protein